MIDKLKRHMAIRRSSAAIVRLFSGNMSEPEETGLKAWPGDSPEYQNRFQKTMQLMADMEMLAQDTDLLELVNQRRSLADPKVPCESKSAEKNGGSWYKLAIAASLVLAVGAAIFFQYQPVVDDAQVWRYVTRIGEQKTVNLDDGSKITLNTNSHLLVTFSNNSRNVIMERGEAFFDIVKDPQRPFNVDLDGQLVTVLGTSFNILKSPEKFTLAVLEGMVAMHKRDEIVEYGAPVLNPSGSESIQLFAGEQHRVQSGTVVEFDTKKQKVLAYKLANSKKLLGWKTGVIRFDAEPLYKVIKELNRYSAKKILIEDPSIFDLELFATVRLDRINKAMTVLELTLPIKVTQHSDRYILTGKDSGQ